MNDYLRIIYERYQLFKKGEQAELKRVGEPDDLLLRPAFYKLFSGINYKEEHKRLAFILPWVSNGKRIQVSLGAALASVEQEIELRLFQIVRSKEPMDLVQLRRLLTYVEPELDWYLLGLLLLNWNDRNAKYKIVEDFYVQRNNKQTDFN